MIIPGLDPFTVRLVRPDLKQDLGEWNTCYIIYFEGKPPLGYDKRYDKLGCIILINKNGTSDTEFYITIEEPEISTGKSWGTPVDLRYNPFRANPQAFTDQVLDYLYAKASELGKLRVVS
jgi:hypothetical protein